MSRFHQTVSKPRTSDRSVESAATCDVTISDLWAGDMVAAQKDDSEYEVAVVEAQQGRVQVADVEGGIHTYYETETVHVSRVDSQRALLGC